MKIAYLVNQYPKVSHSFIRREIAAMERQGFEVQRIALRGWDAEVVDRDDKAERERTEYVLRDGMGALLKDVVGAALERPQAFLKSLVLAMRMARNGERALPYHLAYLAEAARVVRMMRRSGALHLHAHFGTNSAEIAMLAQCLGGAQYSFTVHGPEEFDKPVQLGLGEKIHRSAFTVAISSYGRSQLFRWAGHRDWRKVGIVHCGLEPAFYAGEQSAPSAAPRLVCVGRLCEQKGQLLLVEAAHLLEQAGVGFELVLAGDGEMRREIEGVIAQYGLQEKIRITGWIGSEQVRAELLAARALVLPSFAEGLPVVLMEAMSLHRPVLTTYVAGIPELVKDDENGWLFPAGDIEELARAMRACLESSPARLEQMGRAAYARVVERHSVDTEAGKLAAMIRGSLPAPAGAAL
ncbi:MULTISPECIES: glycosyltransferase family 4 protein [unclassified Herbaspirillum]|uniref:glycosyltransferase family 4 protein n=1 Tax=unclassified Herbaspirillum TaxID=2624150 RepID=UPI001150351C|nr:MULTISPECIES: glycosyltransferase family 4 protein [unclassified Herbaspirillum]MBB5392877.1 glycosyltransferase involved in cell wall biosynthesis [Herbaspirillum sp. SJZ102]TQK04477.1 glycosyltransferase involved in cell wall biosynthesis [Herbaspirillum sp. SJZ130]TQK09738.1 glycosyltransferase involved in cell wall biosynthesis [Herbaspirillum sp. SJZ106]